MSDGLLTLVGLVSAAHQGPANAGCRTDSRICTAQGGECRYNSQYYTMGMRDAKSWMQPYADNSCPERCCYLRDKSRDIPQEQRDKLIQGLLSL